MLRQQPDRRPTAMSLLNRPRLQPPTYDLPGMEADSTRDTKLFDPPNRDSRDFASRRAEQGTAINTAVKAAFSPRVRSKLANQIFEESKTLDDEKYGIHLGQKGIIDDADSGRRGSGTPARPTYPASPMIVAKTSRQGGHGNSGNGIPSEMRTRSRDAKLAHQPLSARPKVRMI